MNSFCMPAATRTFVVGSRRSPPGPESDVSSGCSTRRPSRSRDRSHRRCLELDARLRTATRACRLCDGKRLHPQSSPALRSARRLEVWDRSVQRFGENRGRHAGRPVSAELARQGCIEVNRVCVRDTQPHALVENACSMLYGYACREAFRRGYSRVVTYTLTSESGVSLRAAGFVPVAGSEGGTCNRVGRPRLDSGSTAPKLRWERWNDQRSVAVQTRLPLAA